MYSEDPAVMGVRGDGWLVVSYRSLIEGTYGWDNYAAEERLLKSSKVHRVAVCVIIVLDMQ